MVGGGYQSMGETTGVLGRWAIGCVGKKARAVRRRWNAARYWWIGEEGVKSDEDWVDIRGSNRGWRGWWRGGRTTVSGTSVGRGLLMVVMSLSTSGVNGAGVVGGVGEEMAPSDWWKTVVHKGWGEEWWWWWLMGMLATVVVSVARTQSIEVQYVIRNT